MSLVNKRTLSPSCAVNRICWSRLEAPCFSAEDGSRCRAPRTHPSFDKDKKLWRKRCCFHKTWVTGLELKLRQLNTDWDEEVRLSANDTNTGAFCFRAEVCTSAALTEPWEFCMSCFRGPYVKRKLLQGHIHSIRHGHDIPEGHPRIDKSFCAASFMSSHTLRVWPLVSCFLNYCYQRALVLQTL